MLTMKKARMGIVQYTSQQQGWNRSRLCDSYAGCAAEFRAGMCRGRRLTILYAGELPVARFGPAVVDVMPCTARQSRRSIQPGRFLDVKTTAQTGSGHARVAFV
jgi:hypothetical protein